MIKPEDLKVGTRFSTRERECTIVRIDPLPITAPPEYVANYLFEYESGFQDSALFPFFNAEHNRVKLLDTPTKHANLRCTRCDEPNEYAEPNQPNGTYKCWSCRR